MKKLSRFSAVIFPVLFLGVPMFVSADDGLQLGEYCGASPSDCATGLYCDPEMQVCYGTPVVPGGSGASSAPSPDPGIPLNEQGVPYTKAQIDAANNASPGLNALSGGAVNTTYLEGYKKSIVGIINTILIPVLMAIAFIVFLWGVYKYFIYGASNEGEKAEGRKFAMWGVIGFVIILSLWGLVNIVKDTLNLNQAGSNVPAYPTL